MMKKMFLILACSAALLPLFAQNKKTEKVPAVVVSGGEFRELAKVKVQNKMVDFVKHWNYHSNKPYKVEKNAAGTYEVTTGGCFAGGFGVPKNCPSGYDYKVTITAKGKFLAMRTWSWEGYNPRTNHRRLTLPEKYALTDQYKDYSFTFPCLPKEYYVVLWIDGEKTIKRVRCELVPAKGKVAEKPAAKNKK